MQAPRDRRGRMVLALGEATGHAHVVTGDRVALLCPPDEPDRLFLQIDGYGRLGHHRHGDGASPAEAVDRQRDQLLRGVGAPALSCSTQYIDCTNYM